MNPPNAQSTCDWCERKLQGGGHLTGLPGVICFVLSAKGKRTGETRRLCWKCVGMNGRRTTNAKDQSWPAPNLVSRR